MVSHLHFDNNFYNTICRISQLCASKLLVYTCHSHLFGLIPSIFPSTNVKEDSKHFLRSIVTDDLNSLVIFKVSSDISEGKIERHIENFMNDKNKSLLLLIANMKEITVKMVNYLRVLIEQHENLLPSNEHKLVLIVLQLPRFFSHCYPVLFLNGWDHFYLDSLTTDIQVPGIPKALQNVVDIRQCFRTALGILSENDTFSLNLQPFLEQAIPVISSRVIVGSSGSWYNTPMSVSTRQAQLKHLFIKDDTGTCTSIGEAICHLFQKYWDSKAITKFLQSASHFTFCNLSTLSITNYIQTKIKALFFEFVVYILWKINEDCNLDTYLPQYDELFTGVINNLFSKLPTLSSLSFVCQNLATPTNKGFKLPFFGMLYHYLEEVFDECQEIVSKTVNNKATKAAFEESIFKEMKKKLHQILEVSNIIPIV